MYKGLLNKQFLCNTGGKISCSALPIFFFVVKKLLDAIPLALVPQERLTARRVRPDQRWDAGVKRGDGSPGNNATKGRSLLPVDQPCAIQAFPGGKA
jgi:hypothetical protein